MTRTAPASDSRTTENKEQQDATKIGRDIEALILERSSSKAITLSRLVKEISGQLDHDPDRVVAEVMRLQSNGKIRVREPIPYRKLVKYLLSPLSLWFWEPMLATLFSLALLFASSGPAVYLRVVFGGVLVLFLPGYSLVGFIYSKREELDELSRIAFSFVMSLAVAILVGLALNYTPFGITLAAVALSLAALTIGLLFLTALRKYACYRLARGITTAH